MQFNARIGALTSTAIVALLVGCASAAAEDRALLIGINDYLNSVPPDQPGIHDLFGTGHDVQNMRQLLLSELGYQANQVMTLTESRATRQAIIEAIQGWLIAGTQPGDRIFLYFSGHGAAVAIPDGDKTRLTSGLVPYDADSQIASDAPTAGGLLLGSQLRDLLEQMSGRAVTVISDSCQSGSLTRGVEGAEKAPFGIKTITPNGPATLRAGDITAELIAQVKSDPSTHLFDFNRRGSEDVIENVAAWSAATIAQYSYDGGDGGVFTNAFIAGLRDRSASPGDGRVTVSAQLAYVRSVTASFCGATKDCPNLGFVPMLASTDSYRASVMVPFLPPAPTTPVDNPNVPLESPPAPIEQPPVVAPTVGPDAVVISDGPALINLTQDVFQHINDFDLAVSILPSDRVKLGSAVRFRINSAESGLLMVLDTAPDGKLRRIFPNVYSEATHHEGKISANRPLTIPDETYAMDFIATDAGLGTLIVLVAEPGTDFSEIIAASPEFDEAAAPAKALLAVAAELQEPLLNPDPQVPNRSRRWAFATIPYYVGN